MSELSKTNENRIYEKKRIIVHSKTVMRISVAQILLLALGNTVGMASPAVGQAVLDAKISVSAENNTIKIP